MAWDDEAHRLVNEDFLKRKSRVFLFCFMCDGVVNGNGQIKITTWVWISISNGVRRLL